MSKPLSLGIDIGGTGIKVGLVDNEGKLGRVFRFSTPSKSDPKEVCELIVAQVEALLHAAGRPRIVGIGIGAAGDIDPVNGVVRISPNLNWKNAPLKAFLAKRLKYSIRVENDANAAAWAAFVVEAKRKVKNLLCVTIGTGVGGGLVIDGKLYRGTSGSAGEIGHMTLIPEGIPCNCGNNGCLERYIGAKAMTEEARRTIEAGEHTILTKLVKNDLSKITPLLVNQAAKQRDRLSMRLYEQAGERLGIGLASLVNIINPEWIVFAGGLSRAGRLLLEPVRQTLYKRAFHTPVEAVKLVVSRLDQDLGIVGAGLLAHERG